ncbi:MAG: hypothetical protein EA398_08380 [Deltaproteobacteria bacterium]|nr:MAG: hypothetical protein EA398_08380 [Deltaproteobacteria bacterium]
MTSSRHDGHRWIRRILPVAGILLLLQILLAAAALVHVTTADFDRAVRILGETRPLAHAPTPLRVHVYARHTGLGIPQPDLTATIDPGDGPQPLPLSAVDSRGEFLQTTTRLSGEARVHLTASLAPGDERQLSLDLIPSSGRDPFADPSLWRPPPTGRRGGPQIGSGERPGVRFVGPLTSATAAEPSTTDQDSGSPDSTDQQRPPDVPSCDWDVRPVSLAGPPARWVRNPLLVRFVRADGTPAARTTVHLARTEGEGPVPPPLTRTTDSLGILGFDVRPENAERWTVRWTCDDAPVERTLLVAPSWAGIGLLPPPGIHPDGEPLPLQVEQQRHWGSWNASLFCEGRWVHTESAPVREGLSRVTLQPGPLGARETGAMRICRVAASTSLSTPEQRGFWIAVADGDLDPNDRAAALLERVQRAQHRLGPHLADASAATLTRARPDEAERFAQWLLAVPEPPSLRWPLLADDQDAHGQRMQAWRERHTRRLVLLLLADGGLITLGMAAFAIPALRRRRRALMAVIDDIDAAADDPDACGAPAEELVDSRRAILALVFAMGAVVCFGIALATLVSFMR